MNSKYKKSWINALRSGKFTQGRLQLSLDGKYCCLGVLCKIAGVPEVNSSLILSLTFGGNISTLTVKLMNEFGLSYKDQTRLTTMNDREKKSFAEIADYIETNL